MLRPTIESSPAKRRRIAPATELLWPPGAILRPVRTHPGAVPLADLLPGVGALVSAGMGLHHLCGALDEDLLALGVVDVDALRRRYRQHLLFTGAGPSCLADFIQNFCWMPDKPGALRRLAAECVTLRTLDLCTEAELVEEAGLTPEQDHRLLTAHARCAFVLEDEDVLDDEDMRILMEAD